VFQVLTIFKSSALRDGLYYGIYGKAYGAVEREDAKRENLDRTAPHGDRGGIIVIDVSQVVALREWLEDAEEDIHEEEEEAEEEEGKRMHEQWRLKHTLSRRCSPASPLSTRIDNAKASL